MRIRGVGRVKQYWRRVTSPLRSHAVILMYHRVFEASSDPFRICVTPNHFAEHVQHLQRNYSVFTLQDLVRSLVAGKVPKQSVVLTFDDGYVDNLWYAKPKLEQYGVPGTILVTTGYVGQDREFWWDSLERLLLQTPVLPERLQVTFNGAKHEWNVGKWTQLPSDTNNNRWHVGKEYPTERHRVFRELHALLRPLPHDERQEALSTLLLAQTNGQQARPGYRALTAEEVRRIGDGALIEIGSHTVTHPSLAYQSRDAQRRELMQSKAFLEDVVGKPIHSFCYPYGGSDDISETTISLVQEAGYAGACDTAPGIVNLQANPYRLPRFMVYDWDGDEFARRLRGFFESDPIA